MCSINREHVRKGSVCHVYCSLKRGCRIWSVGELELCEFLGVVGGFDSRTLEAN